jgi:hypothetical protein
MDELGIEPKAFRMRNGRSTTELHALGKAGYAEALSGGRDGVGDDSGPLR